MGISDKIEAFISELIKNEQKEYLELGRNELAEIFNCVPSQINYVLNTRFNPEHGYIIKSKRGGGGYLRIYRINADDMILDIVSSLDIPQDSKTCFQIIKTLFTYDIVSAKDAEIMMAAISENSIPENLNHIRSKVLKNMIYTIRKE